MATYEMDANELLVPAFLPKTHIVFTNNISKSDEWVISPLEWEWCDVELSYPNPSIEISKQGAFWGLRRISGSPAYHIYAFITTKPLPQDPRPAAKFSIRLTADGVDNDYAFNGKVEVVDYAYCDEKYKIRLYGDSNLSVDLLSDEQQYATISQGWEGENETANGEPLFTLNCKKVGFVCLRCWKNISQNQPSKHAYKIVQILPPKEKKLQTPFINRVAYALTPNEELAINASNFDNLSVKSMDESIVQILDLDSNGFLVNGTTKTKGISVGETLLKWTAKETASRYGIEFFTPIRVITSEDGIDDSGGFNGSAIGGNMNFTQTPITTQLLKRDETLILSGVDINSNSSVSGYPRIENLTPNILNLSENSTSARNCEYTISPNGNGVGVVALFADDVNQQKLNGITPTSRQKMCYQVAVFDVRKVYNKVLCGDGDKNSQGIYEEIKQNKVYDFH